MTFEEQTDRNFVALVTAVQMQASGSLMLVKLIEDIEFRLSAIEAQLGIEHPIAKTVAH